MSCVGYHSNRYLHSPGKLYVFNIRYREVSGTVYDVGYLIVLNCFLYRTVTSCVGGERYSISIVLGDVIVLVK